MVEEQLSGTEQTSQALRITGFLAQHWIWVFAFVFGLYVWLPWLSPIFMYIGWTLPGMLIQKVYSTQCHQLPDRSFFLFGPQVTYSLQQVQAVWKNTLDPAVLRQFIGNSQMGWKVAWSDRMVAMYTSTWALGLLWWFARKRIRPLPLWGLILFWMPMAIDGGTHFFSDIFAGIGAGFRYDNAWLASLTGHMLPSWFYYGDALGSFNSDMRLLTGLLFGIGLVWFAFPILDESFRSATQPHQVVLHSLPPYESHYSSPAISQHSSQATNPSTPHHTSPASSTGAITHHPPEDTKST